MHIAADRCALSLDANVPLVGTAFGPVYDMAKVVPKVQTFGHAVQFARAASAVIGRPPAYHLQNQGIIFEEIKLIELEIT